MPAKAAFNDLAGEPAGDGFARAFLGPQPDSGMLFRPDVWLRSGSGPEASAPDLGRGSDPFTKADLYASVLGGGEPQAGNPGVTKPAPPTWSRPVRQPDGSFVVMSTSLLIDPAYDRVAKLEDGVILRIHVPRGCQALYVEPITTKRGQHELLLPSGRRYHILGQGGSYRGKPIINVELINEQ